MSIHLPLSSVPLPDCSGMRIMLINPSQSYPIEIADEYQSYFPVGIASLGAAIEPTGASIRLVDCLASDDTKSENGLVWFGMSLEDLRREVEDFSPHVVGICNAFSMFINDTLRVAELVKAVDRRIIVVVGGIEASVAPNNVNLLKRNESIDLLVKGEGEMTLRDLVGHFELASWRFRELDGVLGILYRDESGAIAENASRPWIRDLDALPFPAYHLLDMDKMFSNPHYARWRSRATNGRCIPMHTSRGCPYSCSFCSVHSQVGKPNRRHSPEYVVRHIKHLQDNYGITHIHFEDDNLTLNPKHTAELFKALVPLGITFDTPNGIRADTVTPETARLFREAGAKFVAIAVESGVQRILDEVVRKALDLDDVVKAAAALRDAEVPCIAFFIIGFPGETEEDVRESLRFAKRLAREYNTINYVFVANPLPGTPLHQECLEKKYLIQPLDKVTMFGAIRLNQSPLIATPEFTKHDLFEWTRDELLSNDFHAVGPTILFFFSDNQDGWGSVTRWLGGEYDKNTLAPYPWMADERVRMSM
jgi:anaerobic magnesium-protoporphyrin IX monomethyl ester cyclase